MHFVIVKIQFELDTSYLWIVQGYDLLFYILNKPQGLIII